MTVGSSQSQGTDRIWTQKTLDQAKLSSPPPSHLVNYGALVLFLLLLTFIPHLVGEGEAPRLLILWPAGQERAWAPDSGAAVSMSNACRFLPGPARPSQSFCGPGCRA